MKVAQVMNRIKQWMELPAKVQAQAELINHLAKNATQVVGDLTSLENEVGDMQKEMEHKVDEDGIGDELNGLDDRIDHLERNSIENFDDDDLRLLIDRVESLEERIQALESILAPQLEALRAEWGNG